MRELVLLLLLLLLHKMDLTLHVEMLLLRRLLLLLLLLLKGAGSGRWPGDLLLLQRMDRSVRLRYQPLVEYRVARPTARQR
ncbi:hypothetical protein BC939DRAFT_442643 [Gamsiella multidivaricata]|uniref:uncharacterized protein n=1 Tax=Gamsiella multidivaricata TaxID=101098 RepID=UPI00221E61CE|nr:uncharacterized protein BC939DRAFT_442643 [Gamsiella multidivaricata]KAI7828696.1 hypothetical protein BC939DRAFT_442643 [Gamsiella multidivaricata]